MKKRVALIPEVEFSRQFEVLGHGLKDQVLDLGHGLEGQVLDIDLEACKYSKIPCPRLKDSTNF